MTNYSLFAQKKIATKKENALKAIELTLSNLKEMETGSGYHHFKVLNIGRLLEGEAYYHEVDQYYNCIGIEVEIESQFQFENGTLSDRTKDVGFYSVWVGKSHKYAPYTFEESYQDLGKAHRFDNGLGDRIEVTKEIMSLEEMQELVKKNSLLG